ncbi:hypothetical protein C8Q77DRAFT_1069472 [Trametes polyzona]|nr:hypothetical protein C8Q77DRAFT_1069472 [Trametes polyzona]
MTSASISIIASTPPSPPSSAESSVEAFTLTSEPVSSALADGIKLPPAVAYSALRPRPKHPYDFDDSDDDDDEDGFVARGPQANMSGTIIKTIRKPQKTPSQGPVEPDQGPNELDQGPNAPVQGLNEPNQEPNRRN